MELEDCYRILRDLAGETTVTPPVMLSEAETTAILDLAREVAHAVERKAAPLVCYSVGRGMSDAGDEERLAFLSAAMAALASASTDGPVRS